MKTRPRSLGLNEAIVLEELVFRQGHACKSIAKRRWFYTPVASTKAKKNDGKFPPLQVKFPWLSKSAIHKILDNLRAKKLICINSFNQKSYDHTRWYSVDKRTVRRVKAAQKLQLSLADVLDYGPSAALVLNHSQYESRRTGDAWIYLSPDKCVHRLPLSENTIRRALKKLVAEGELERDNSYPYYKLCKANPLPEHCGKVARKCEEVYTPSHDYAEGNRTPVDEPPLQRGSKVLLDRTSYCEWDIPELERMAIAIANEYTLLTDRDMSSIKLPELCYFNEAAFICFKNGFHPDDFVHAQLNDTPHYPKPWMPEILIRDDAEERALLYKDTGSHSPVHREAMSGCSAR